MVHQMDFCADKTKPCDFSKYELWSRAFLDYTDSAWSLKSNTENKGKFLSFSLEVTLTTTKYNPVNCYDSVFERTLKCQEIWVLAFCHSLAVQP